MDTASYRGALSHQKTSIDYLQILLTWSFPPRRSWFARERGRESGHVASARHSFRLRAQRRNGGVQLSPLLSDAGGGGVRRAGANAQNLLQVQIRVILQPRMSKGGLDRSQDRMRGYQESRRRRSSARTGNKGHDKLSSTFSMTYST